MIEYVGGFLKCGGHITLIEKTKPDWQKGKFNAIGGKIEVGETPAQAMVREAYEEAGIICNEQQWHHRLVLKGNGYKIHFFMAFVNDLLPLQSGPEGKVDWFPIGGMPFTIIHNIIWILSMCLDLETPGPVNVEVP